MSWFGFGGKKDSEPSQPVSAGNYDHNPYDSSSYAEPSASAFPSSNSGRSLQEEIQLEAQKIEIQQMILQLTQMAFDKCVNKPSSSLSGSERSCIEGSIGKYIDTKMLISQKLTGGGGQQ